MSLMNLLNNQAFLGNAGGQTQGYNHQQYSQTIRIQQESLNDYQSLLGQFMGSQPDMSHIGTVKEFRKKFKEYTKAEFRELGNKPVIKDILSGMTKLNKEQTKERIAEHLAII